MKSLTSIAFVLFLLFSSGLYAQQEYTVEGKTYTLKTEVEGALTLLWNTIDGEYRYFSKKGEDIEELTNTKVNKKYQEEFKEVLQRQTADKSVSTKKVNLTLPSLSSFFVEYNTLKDPSFADNKPSTKLNLRLGGFAGVDNSIYTYNPENAMHPIVGAELEVVDNYKLRRHSMVLRFEQTFESSDHKYSASQFSLNYRFKFIKSSKLDVFINAKFASLTFSSMEMFQKNSEGNLETIKTTGSDYNVPLTLGIGADYKVGNGYITFNYNDIVGLNMDSNKEFPINFSLGYKFNL